MGRKQLKEDYAKAAEKHGSGATGIKDLQFDPETITFSFEGNGKSVSFTLYISDDYPEGTTLYPSDGEPQYFSASLSSVLDDVCSEYGQKFGVTGAQKVEKKTEAPTPSKKTIDLRTSNGGDSSEEDDVENYYEMSPQLIEEMAYVKQQFGQDSVSLRTFGNLDMLNLEIHINYPFLPSVAAAWGVNKDLPITVRFHVSPSMYLTALQPPKVEILQAGQMCGLSTQLSLITRNFCTAHWAKFNGSFQKKKLKTSATGINFATGTVKPKAEIKTAGAAFIKNPKVRQLVEMGFPADIAERTLEATKGNVDEAAALLLDSPHADHIDGPKRPNTSLNYQERKDIFLQEQKDQAEKVHVVDYTDGFLGAAYKYLYHRIPTLNKYCVICDNSHLFASAHLLRPAVCARELCCFAFQSLGVCSGATDGIATQAEVVDLLVCMAMAAANSQRHETIFDPFPTVFDPLDANVIVLNPQKKDFQALKKILAHFPSVEDMTLAQEAKDIKQHMDTTDMYAFPLLQWIINSNRSHIEKLIPRNHIKSMNTPHQYVLITAPPEKEDAFAKLKAKHGTVYAFHGSPVENWHCILRTGLRNASGTNLQLHGAAYGKGIYLSPAASMSFGYSTRHFYGATPTANTQVAKNGNRFLSSSDFYCVALCEVANLPDIKKSGDVWVCPSEDAVVTRFFFVYPKSHTGPPSAHASQPAFVSEVEAALRDRMP